MSQNIHDFEFNPSSTRVFIWKELLTSFQVTALHCIAQHFNVETDVVERERYIHVPSNGGNKPSHDT